MGVKIGEVSSMAITVITPRPSGGKEQAASQVQLQRSLETVAEAAKQSAQIASSSLGEAVRVSVVAGNRSDPVRKASDAEKLAKDIESRVLSLGEEDQGGKDEVVAIHNLTSAPSTK